jgi:hypothetical protein
VVLLFGFFNPISVIKIRNFMLSFISYLALILSFLINEVVLSTRSVSQIPRNFVTIGRGTHQQVRRSPTIGINQTEIFIGFIHCHAGN